MKLTFSTFLGAVFLTIGSLGIQTTASAIPITGEIDFLGTAALNGPLETATQVSHFYNIFGAVDTATVSQVSGDFANPVFAIVPVVSSAAFAHPYTFSPSTDTNPLWSVGGFSFDLMSSTVVTQSSTFLNIAGLGTISGNGFTPTAGSWSFTISSSGTTPASGRFGFNANTAALPDGGSAVALFGFAIIAVEGVRRVLNATSPAK